MGDIKLANKCSRKVEKIQPEKSYDELNYQQQSLDKRKI
jgi:hypothetical protein